MKLILLILALYALVCFSISYLAVHIAMRKLPLLNRLRTTVRTFSFNMKTCWNNLTAVYKAEIADGDNAIRSADDLIAASERYQKMYIELIPAVQMTTGQSAIFEILSTLIPEEYVDYHLLPTISPVRKDLVLRTINRQIEQENLPALNPYKPGLDPEISEIFRKEAYKLIVIGIIDSGLQNIITNRDTYLQHIAGTEK